MALVLESGYRGWSWQTADPGSMDLAKFIADNGEVKGLDEGGSKVRGMKRPSFCGYQS